MTRKITLLVNYKEETFSLPSGTVLLDVLRDVLGLKGTKEGCREGDCGSCIVLWGRLKNGCMEYRIVNSCMFPLGDAENSHIVTIEGLNQDELSPVQEFMIDENASQCGFCTPGFVVSMVGYFLHAKTLNIEEAKAFLSGNICRCTGYSSINRAMERAIQIFDEKIFTQSYQKDRIELLVKHKLLPEYFLSIAARLQEKPKPVQDFSGNFIVGGGTDLYVQKEDTVTATEDIYHISVQDGFKGITISNGKCRIGAATTVTELREDESFAKAVPDFVKFIPLISSESIRNRATLGGNIVNASPIGDLSVMFLAMDASLTLQIGSIEREIKLKDFFLDYKKIDLQKGEIIKTVSIPLPPPDSTFHFEKVSRRIYLDIASVNTAAMLAKDGNTVTHCLLSAGGVAPFPKFLSKASDFITGKELSLANIEETVQIALGEVSPISDVRGSAEYKLLLLKQLLLTHFS